MSKLLAMMLKPKPIMYATIKGSLTDNDGVFSNFSDSSYLELQQPFILNADTVAEIVIKINFDNAADQIFLGHPNTYGIQMSKGSSDNKIHLFLGNNSSWTLINNAIGTIVLSNLTEYYIKIAFNKGNVQILLSTDKINWITEINRDITLTEEYAYIIDFGKGRVSGQYLKGTINFNQSYIKINNTKYQIQAVVGYKEVGTPTIVDGVVSGFSNNGNYLQINKTISLGSNFEIVVKVKTGTLVNTDNSIISGLTNQYISIGYNRASGSYKFQYNVGNGSSWITTNPFGDTVISSDTEYLIKFTFNGNTYTAYLSTDNGNNWVVDKTLSSSQIIPNFTLNIGVGRTLTTCWQGSIDLNETYIKTDGKLWFNGQPA